MPLQAVIEGSQSAEPFDGGMADLLENGATIELNGIDAVLVRIGAGIGAVAGLAVAIEAAFPCQAVGQGKVSLDASEQVGRAGRTVVVGNILGV